MAASSSAVILPDLDGVDQAVELLQPPLEGPQQGVGRTGQAALEDHIASRAAERFRMRARL